MTTLDYDRARHLMVEQQIRPWDVLDLRVLEVLSTLPREAFVTKPYQALAYADVELPIGHGQKMMKPVIAGRTLQALNVQPEEDVLEIGTGSGFLTACLGKLAHSVVSLDQHLELIEQASDRLAAQWLGNIRLEHADAFYWDNSRQFDVICATGAVYQIPEQWLHWLRPNGRLFVFCGRSPAMEALLIKKVEKKSYERHLPSTENIQSLFETDIAYLTGAAPPNQFDFSDSTSHKSIRPFTVAG